MADPRPIRRKTVRMPEVVGIKLENARLMLTNHEFDLSKVRLRYEEAYRPEDEVLRQQPAAGAVVASDEPVELVISRRSLINHLPQVYQKAESNGRHLLRDFLWVFDHIYADLERTLNGLHRYFDPLEAPNEFLPWLASWVALTINQSWEPSKKRKLIREAIGIYGYRGTIRGLKLFLSIFTDVEPDIYENKWPYKGFRIGKVRVGVDSVVIPQVNLSHCFMVEIPAEYRDVDDNEIIKIHDIIRMEKPSHTAYCLTFKAAPKTDALQPFRIGLGRLGLRESGVMGSRPMSAFGEALADELAGDQTSDQAGGSAGDPQPAPTHPAPEDTTE